MIKNVGEGAAEAIIESRELAGGAFDSLDDFSRQLNTRNVNKRALESLIKTGCLDSAAGTNEARGAMLVNLDRIMGIAQSALKLKETGQTTMFDLFGDEVATPLPVSTWKGRRSHGPRYRPGRRSCSAFGYRSIPLPTPRRNWRPT